MLMAPAQNKKAPFNRTNLANFAYNLSRKQKIRAAHMTFPLVPAYLVRNILRDGTQSRPVTLQLRRRRSRVIIPLIAIKFDDHMGSHAVSQTRSDYPMKSWDYPICPRVAKSDIPAAAEPCSLDGIPVTRRITPCYSIAWKNNIRHGPP